jgi:hypothetical protein
MIKGMNEGFVFSNSTRTQSHYMLKLLAIESLNRRQCCTEPYRLFCTKPCGLFCTKPYWLFCTESYEMFCTEPYGLFCTEPYGLFCTEPCGLYKALQALPQSVFQSFSVG